MDHALEEKLKRLVHLSKLAAFSGDFKRNDSRAPFLQIGSIENWLR